MDMMCRILVVEDEYIMQQGIKYLLDWEKEGFEIVGSATNGKEALELIEKLHPHIVLTDIVMPVMNGADLTAILRSNYPDIQVVALSGYSDFEYVRATFQGGAVDYILKPTLSPQILLETMKKVAERIPNFSRQSREGTPEICLSRMLAGFPPEDMAKTLQQAMPENAFILVGEHVDHLFGSDKAAVQRQKVLLKQMRKEYLEGMYPNVQIVTEEGVLLLVINFPAEQKHAVLDAANAMAQAIAKSEPKIFFVCSPVFDRIEQIREIYKDPFLRYTLRSFYYQGKNFLVREPDMELQPPRLDMSHFSELVLNERIDDALALLGDYVDAVVLVHMPEENELKNTVQSALYQIIIRLEDLGLKAEELARLKQECMTRLQAAAWIESFAQALVDVLADLNTILDEHSIGQTSDVMRDIFTYIDVHYAESITLKSLSNQFNFSYSYLSSYFHAHHRQGFNDYLNSVRVRRAAELLRNGEHISHVCYEVGYGDQSHFTKVFKKYTGHTPSAYRRIYGREGQA